MQNQTQPTIDQMNEVIARFEGRKQAQVNERGKVHIFWSDPTGTNPLYSEELYYHKSWDELMPVVKKIKSLHMYILGSTPVGEYIKAAGGMNNALISIDLERLHREVYQFIIWLNKQKNDGE